MKHEPTGLSTLAVHAGEPRAKAFDALATPIVTTATYTFRDTAELVAYMEGGRSREEYGRYGNPTVRALEEKVAALEGCDDALAFGSGMAAVTTAILALVRSGSHVVLFRDCYRRTRQFVTTVLDRFGVTHTLVEPGDLAGLEQALRPETRLIVSEAPTNPYLNVVDLEALAALARARRIKTLIDATFATPVNLRPAAHGIDLVVQSATEYLGGHNDVLAGVVAGPAALVSLIKDLRDVLGGVCDPQGAYLVLRGLTTLELRVQRQNATALALARALESHPKVARVWYPGLESHPHHAIARRLMVGLRGRGDVRTGERSRRRGALRRRTEAPAHRALAGRCGEPGRAARADELLRPQQRAAGRAQDAGCAHPLRRRRRGRARRDHRRTGGAGRGLIVHGPARVRRGAHAVQPRDRSKLDRNGDVRMAQGAFTHVVLAPAPGVTDLDEWFGRLDAAVSLRSDARWHCKHDALAAYLPEDEAALVADRAREALGDAIDIQTRVEEPSVLVTDAVAGRPIDE
jgi:cystathionine gamma-synthase